MSTAVKQLEQRVQKLEKDIKAIKSQLTNHTKQPWWQETLGMFKGDKAFAEIVRLGRKIREADRKRPR